MMFNPQMLHKYKRLSTINLRCKVVDVLFLSRQSGFRDKHRKVAVFKANLLDLGIKPALYTFPDAKRPWTQHVAAAYIVVLDHLGLRNYLHTAMAIT